MVTRPIRVEAEDAALLARVARRYSVERDREVTVKEVVHEVLAGLRTDEQGWAG